MKEGKVINVETLKKNLKDKSKPEKKKKKEEQSNVTKPKMVVYYSKGIF